MTFFSSPGLAHKQHNAFGCSIKLFLLRLVNEVDSTMDISTNIVKIFPLAVSKSSLGKHGVEQRFHRYFFRKESIGIESK